MWQPFSARVPWILVRSVPGGFHVRDTRTGEQVTARDPGGVAAFAASHSAAIGYRGLGDAVHSVAKRLGFGECTPCAKRQAALNAAVPRLFRR